MKIQHVMSRTRFLSYLYCFMSFGFKKKDEFNSEPVRETVNSQTAYSLADAMLFSSLASGLHSHPNSGLPTKKNPSFERIMIET